MEIQITANASNPDSRQSKDRQTCSCVAYDFSMEKCDLGVRYKHVNLMNNSLCPQAITEMCLVCSDGFIQEEEHLDILIKTLFYSFLNCPGVSVSGNEPNVMKISTNY